MKEQSLPINYNYSIAFIKVFFCFCVVCCHFWMTDSSGFFPTDLMLRMRAAAVPVYLLTSFFLMEKLFNNPNLSKMKKRIWRLLYPYFIWPILYFVGYWIVDILLRKMGVLQGIGLEYSWQDLLWQLALGSDRFLCPQFWYLFDLVILTVLFWIVLYFSNKYVWQTIIVLAIVAFFIQYSGINYRLFGGYEWEVRYPLGRIAEVIPIACIGLLLAYSGILEKLKQHRVFIVVVSIASMLLIAYGGLFTWPPEGLGYGGTYLAFYAMMAFVLFYVIPFEKMPKVLKESLVFLSRYSFGVFCIHIGIGVIWNNVLCPCLGWPVYSFVGCIGIFMISLILSWCISRIPSKYARQLVE